MAYASAEGPVVDGGGAASPLADDGAEGPVAAAGGADDAAEGPVADDNAERPVAGGGAAGVGPITEGTPEGVGNKDNAAQDSQTVQILPVQGGIADSTRSRMVAKAFGTLSSSFSSLRQMCT